MVVLLIVSIMSGIVVANFPSFTRTADIDSEAKRLEVLLGMARDEASVQAAEYGFKPEGDGYRFFMYDEVAGRWQLVERRPFEPHKLPESMELTLSVEGDEFEISEAKAPPVLILSSGEMTPFELTIESGRGGVKTLVSDGYADLRWSGNKEDEDA